VVEKRSRSLNQNLNLHSLTAAWDEDAICWTKRTASNGWAQPGGDYDASVVDSVSFGGLSAGTWVSLDVPASVVNGWLADPTGNHGLLFKPNYDGQPGQDARHKYTTAFFASSEHPNASWHPKLDITFAPSGNTAPLVSLDLDPVDPTIPARQDVQLTALASDPDTGGSITNVRFYLDGGLIGEDATAPYTVTVHKKTASYAIHVVAFDNTGAAATSDVVNVRATRVIYDADMATDPGWTLEGIWEYGGLTGGGGSDSFPCPKRAVTGTRAVGTDLDADYDGISLIYAEMPVIDCTDYVDVRLSYWAWLGVGWSDPARVQVSTNGTSWTTVWASPLVFDRAVSPFGTGWDFYTVDISSIADAQSSVYVRWGLGPVSPPKYPGWTVDDVKLTGYDNLPRLVVDIDQSAISENGGSSQTTVTRVDTVGDQTITLASSDTSEAVVPPSVVISNGCSNATFAVTGVDDGIGDGTQTVTITASHLDYRSGSNAIDVLDDEPFLTVEIEDASMSENGGFSPATVTRVGTVGDLVAALSSSDTNEATVPTDVTIWAGQTSQIFTVTAVDDVILDGTQTPTITATGYGHNPGSDSIDVTDDEVGEIQFASGTFTGFETGSVVQLTVTRNGSSSGAVSVDYSTVSDSAQAGSDFVQTNGTVSMADSVTTAVFNVEILNDTDSELAETFRVDLSNATANFAVGTPGQANVTILSEDGIVMQEYMDADPGWACEGLWAYGRPMGQPAEYGGPDPTSGHTGPAVYGYNLNGGYENSLPAKHLTTPPIDCSAYTDVGISFERWLGVEQPVYDHAALEVSSNGMDWVTVWTNTTGIEDAAWGHVTYDISSVADGEAAVQIRWAMGDTDEGWSYCGWNIDDVVITGLPDVPRLAVSIDLASMNENGGTSTATVTRVNSGTSGSLLVNLSSDNTNEATVLPSVTIPDGQASAEFTVTAVNDNITDGSQWVTITATADGHAEGSDTIEVTDDDFTQCRMKITFSGYERGTPLTNFPALVILSQGLTNFLYSDFASPNGWDLRFRDATETRELNYEIEHWDTNGESLVWVQVPELSNGTHIWAYWGDAALAHSPAVYTTNGATWGAEYRGVWHMTEANAIDATANGNTGTAGGSPGVSVEANGLIGPAMDFMPSGSGKGHIDLPGAGSLLMGQSFTFSAWVRWDGSSQPDYCMIASKKNKYDDANGWCIETHRDNHNVKILGSSGSGPERDVTIGSTWTAHDWVYLTCVYNVANVTIYADGGLVDSGGIAAVVDRADRTLVLGNEADHGAANWNGLMDEVRCAATLRSADWIWACYSNQVQGSTFCTYGAVEAGGGERDTDGDGMPDAFETRYGLNVSSNDAAGDADGDGMSNYGEYRCNTDPTNGLSVLRFEGATPGTSSEVTLTWQSASGRMYSILICTDLLDTVWDVIESNLTADPPTNTYPVSIGSDGKEFYRIKVE